MRLAGSAELSLDVAPIFRRRLGLESGASGILARQGEEAMKTSRFTGEQILFALKQGDAGISRDGYGIDSS